jgi:glycosyltransferase involved in cell wall biosynthesis
VERGHYISIIIQSDLSRKYRWNGIEVFEIPAANVAQQIHVASRIIRKKRCNVLQVRNAGIDGFIALLLKRMHHVQLVYQYTMPIFEYLRVMEYKSNGLPLTAKMRLFWTDRFQKRTMLGSDLVLAISQWMGKYLETVGIPASKISVFPDGASLERFSCGTQKTLELGETGIPPFTVTYIGTLDRMRELRFLLRAFCKVVNAIPNARLLVVGDGNDRIGMERETERLGIRESTTFTGRVPFEAVPAILKSTRVGVSPIPPIPPYQLSSPLKVFEYMASGIPVVANEEIPDQRNALVNSGGGLVVPYDTAKFAEAIIDILKSPEEGRIMGTKGQAWIAEHRNYESLATEIERLLTGLLQTSS